MNRGLQAGIGRRNRDAQLGRVLAATTVNLMSVQSSFVLLDGNGTVNSFGDAVAPCIRKLRCTGAPTIKASANILTPGGVDMACVAGDIFEVAYLGGLVWVVYNRSLATGSASVKLPSIALLPQSYEPPATNFAQLGFVNGHPVLNFDTTTQWAAIWTFILPTNYTNATGITVLITSILASAIAGTLGYLASIERMDVATNLTADSFGPTTTLASAAVPGTVGLAMIHSVAITKGANMDNAVAGDTCRIKLARDVATDTAAGNSQMLSAEIRET